MHGRQDMCCGQNGDAMRSNQCNLPANTIIV
jgi:hypothetical protein